MLDGVFAVNGVAFIVGMLKLGMFRFTPADAVEAGLLLENTELLALLPKWVVGLCIVCKTCSDNCDPCIICNRIIIHSTEDDVASSPVSSCT